MVPTIEPTLTIPIEANPDGSQPIPHFEFAEDPPALYIVKSVWNDPPVKILWWHAPTGAVLALPVALALLCWCGRRFWNRPRAIGLLYCRSCNHELTPPNAACDADGSAAWLSESGKCPECGRRSGRPPLIGTSLARRLIPTLLSGALVAA